MLTPPATAVSPPAETAPEPQVTQAPVEKPVAVTKAPPKPSDNTAPNFSRQIKRKIIKAVSKANLEIKKEREAEQKRLTKEEFDRQNKAARAAAAGGNPKVTHIDTEGIAGGVVGVATIWSDQFVHIPGQSITANVVTLSALGALAMYVMAMAALFRLRIAEPGLSRPFVAPFYPVAPALALGLASVALVMMVWNNPVIAAIFAGLMAVLTGGSLLLRDRSAQMVAA